MSKVQKTEYEKEGTAMSTKVTAEKFPEIIEVYNAEGKTAAHDLIRNQFGIKNPTCVMKRLKQSAEFSYNPETDLFGIQSKKEEEGLFLNLDDLCCRTVQKQETAMPREAKTDAMEKMIQTLISDRLLEISRYVTLDPVNRQIFIDKTSMQADGYEVSLC